MANSMTYAARPKRQMKSDKWFLSAKPSPRPSPKGRGSINKLI